MSAPARERGSLTVAERVARKIAAQVVSEIAGTYGTTGGVLGVGATADSGARPEVDVEFSAGFMDVAVKVGLAYPTSIQQATARIRDEVTRRVAELTGIAVHRVDIDVTFLHARTGKSGSGAPEALL
ncbi:Asp23/Gls24 family envelope stress response protein [Bogoriella caseilytica]|uniref:Putative alkaline shock family protein YloU n=1 Tax=Bogoriella caseilytica TaxID=56055 RepID=A0A3N2BE03_9MICO|nr:Asp23/Gls24 family envelope stress response protein [Bogoriella caseilytica]ROR73493.1 putative alkaline shock family protein YloU [Bogoriella caseilytica]